MKKMTLVLLGLFLILTSCGKKTENAGKFEPIQLEENVYNIGGQWSRLPVNFSAINSLSKNTQRLIKSVVKIQTTISSGTAFYLGQHAGEFLFATNYHVLPDANFCNFLTTIQLSNGTRAICGTLLAAWPTVDIAFFTVRANPDAQKILESTEALEFEFLHEPFKEEPLMVAGFGRYMNEDRKLTLSTSPQCKIASEFRDYRRVEGPEAQISSNDPGKKYTWSFMHGCEGSQGDSGSPIVSRFSGKVVGVYWGGKTPKGNSMLNKEYVEDAILKNKTKIIWKKFNMAVPATKIRDKIKRYLESNIRHNQLKKSIFTSLIQ